MHMYVYAYCGPTFTNFSQARHFVQSNPGTNKYLYKFRACTDHKSYGQSKVGSLKNIFQ